MQRATVRAFLVLSLAALGCDMNDGPIFEPDAGADAGPEADGGADAGDREAPAVVSTTPASGAVDVAPGASIVIVFSEPMADAGTFELTAGGAALTPTRAWSADRTELTLSAELPPEARVRLVLERDFTDSSGNGLAAPYVLDFTTGDDVPPVVTGSTPVEGATDVSARLAQIRFTFSEPLDASAGALTLEGGPGELGEPAWTLGGLVVPVSGLAYGTSYRVVLDGFADPSGNALDTTDALGDGALDFTTGPDTDPPHVADASPSEGQVEVPDTTSTITVLFDEPMDTSITDATLSAAGASATVSGVWSAGGTRVDFDVAGLLARNTACSLSLAGFRDAAGNALDPAAHLGDGALDFVTGVDIFAPYVGFTDPVEGATDVSFRRATVAVIFSEAMDTSRTSVEVSDGTSSFTATGTWSLAGTRFEIDVSGRFYATRSYTIDFSAFTDAGGTALDASHPYLGDGVLGFTLAAPTGENCRDALTVAEATSSGGALEWVIAPGAVVVNDGSNTCPGGNTPGVDAVIRYTKTTPAASSGGTALRIYVESAETVSSAWMSVAVLRDECDPSVAGLGPARLRCVDDDNPQHVYLDVGPGDYYVWVSRYTGTDFRGGTVRIEEVAAPPEGESCLAPFTTSSAIYTAPASSTDAHRWTLPLNAVQAMDHAVAYNGPGAMVCDERIGGGPDTNVGNDAVIELPKASATSIGWLHVASVHTSYELVAQLLDRCDATDPAATSLACEDGLRIISSTPRTLETTFTGPAGARYLWLANDASYNDFPGAIVSYREVEPGPGDTCATAIPLTINTTTAITPDRPYRLPAPSCFGSAAAVTWYRFTVPERALVVTGTATDATPGALALVAASSGAELSCATDVAAKMQNAFLTPGTEVCLAVESSRVASLTVDAIPYDGLSGKLTDLLIDRPLGSTGSERGLASSQWMQVTPTTVYLGIGTGSSASSVSNFLAYAPRVGGVRADANDAYQGPVNGYAAVAIGEAIFAVDDSTTAGTAARLNRIVDSFGVYGAVAWDTGTSYPAYSIRSIAYDGTDLWLVSHATTTTSHQTRVWRASPTTPGPLTLVGDIPGVDHVLAIALDSTYLYLAATGSGGAGVFRLARADLGPTTPTPERIATLSLPPATTDIVLDDPAAPSNLYVRTSAGVDVVARPASADPRHLGQLVAVTGSGRPMARDPITGGLYVIDTASSDQRFLRLD